MHLVCFRARPWATRVCWSLYPRHVSAPWGAHVAVLCVCTSGVECAVSPLRSRMTSPPPGSPDPGRGGGRKVAAGPSPPPPPGSVHLQQLWRVKNSPGASGSGRGRGTRGGRAEGGGREAPPAQQAEGGCPGPTPARRGQPARLQQGGSHILPAPPARPRGTPPLQPPWGSLGPCP